MEILEFIIYGDFEGEKISTKTTDISFLRSKLSEIEDFISGDLSKSERGKISVEYKEGSVKINAVLDDIGSFNHLRDDLVELSKFDPDLSLLNKKRGGVIESWQKEAQSGNYNFDIVNKALAVNLEITPETNYKLDREIFLDSELYLYGEICDMGGKSRINIHIDTERYGYLKVKCDKEQIKGEENRLYEFSGLKVIANQNVNTGEIERASLIEFLPNETADYESEIENFISESSTYWEAIDEPGEWVRSLRDEN